MSGSRGTVGGLGAGEVPRATLDEEGGAGGRGRRRSTSGARPPTTTTASARPSGRTSCAPRPICSRRCCGSGVRAGDGACGGGPRQRLGGSGQAGAAAEEACREPLPQASGADSDVAEDRRAGQHDARGAAAGGEASLLLHVAEEDAAADLDQHALGHEQFDVAEDAAGVDSNT